MVEMLNSYFFNYYYKVFSPFNDIFKNGIYKIIISMCKKLLKFVLIYSMLKCSIKSLLN